MGKSSKKITKNQQVQKTAEEERKMKISKKELEEIIAKGDSEKGLEQVIQFLESGHKEPFILLAAAELYFQAGDYVRAAQWIDNTLFVDPGNADARILLASICLLEDRIEESFKIYEFVLKNNRQMLSEKDCQDIKKKLGYYCKIEQVKIETEYPILAKFLGMTAAVEGNAVERSWQADKINEEMKANNDICENNLDVAKIKKGILQKNTDLKEKIAVCNSFAGACFLEQKLAEAEEFLAMALSFDCQDKETLRNLVYLALEQQDKEKALQYATQMKETDFYLLQQIRKA